VGDSPVKDDLAETAVSRDPDFQPGGAPSPPAGREPRVSREEPGRYDVREERARGGMGRILVAFDAFLGREVAFKELLRELADRDAARRFLREARITGQLEHPNIVPVHEVGQADDGTLYYTMRLVRGRTLTAALADCRGLAERLRYLGAFWNLCNAVAFAHSRGVVHRDLKPGNVMVGEFGETVLIDWGLARVSRAEPGQTAPDLLEDGQEGAGEELGEASRGGAVGTPAYMSPEQASGRPADARSDVWGLGAVLYEILTGAPPFDAAPVTATLEQVRFGRLRQVRALCPAAPAELAAVAQKALARKPEDRYQSARELAEDVHCYISGDRVRAYAYSSWELARHFASRHRAAVAGGGLAMLAVVAALFAVSAALATEQQAHRLSELSLAQAHLERSQRALSQMDLDETRRFAAASLLHNPAWPAAPSHDASFARGSAAARSALVEARTTLFEAEARAIVEQERELPTRDVVGAVAFSRDGRRLASSAQRHGEVRLWDLEEGALVRSFVAPAGEVGALALSGDGALVARGSERHGLEVFEAQTGRQVFATETGRGGARGLAFAPGGLLLASFSRSPPAVFEAATGKVVRQLPDELAPASAALSADGRTLACAAQEALLLFGFPDLAPAGRLEPRVGPLELVAVSPDGARVAATRPARTVASLEVAAPAHPQILRGHLEAITALAFTGDGRRLVSQSFDGVRVWDVASGQLLMLLRGRNAAQSVAAASDGARLAVGGVDERVRVLRFAREPQIRSFAAHSDATRSVAFSADGRRVATGGGGKDASARVWDAATLAPLATLAGAAGSVMALSCSPDGRRLALGGRAGELSVWDWERQAPLYRVPLGERVFDAAFSPDGSLVAQSGASGTVRLFDAASGALAGALVGHEGTVGGLAFSPDGKLLATAGTDHTVRLWDVATRREERVLRGHRDWAWAVDFSADGRSLATGGKDGEILLWELAGDGAAPRRLRGHAKWVNVVEFSPDGRALLSCSDDRTVRVWDVASGEETMILHSSHGVDAARLAPDGRTLAYGEGPAAVLAPASLPALRD